MWRLQGCEPRSLLPAAATARCGGEVVGALFSQLVDVDSADGEPSWGSPDDRAVADRVDSDDGRIWTIDLEEGWTFHDGEVVSARSFVDAWTFAALPANAQANSFLFDDIVGARSLACEDPDCILPDEGMEGLEVVDEDTLRVTLTSVDWGFPVGSATLPSPPAQHCAARPSRLHGGPVGNGPMRMEGSWATRS